MLQLPVSLLATLLLAIVSTAWGLEPVPASRPVESQAPEGYLFAHMLKGDYGRLYYAISPDGLKWSPLNGGKRINDDYLGHPDIARGHDGRFYMIGVGRAAPEAVLWVSENLVDWKIERELDAAMFDDVAVDPDPPWRGAPKLFYDEATQQYLVTWHATKHPKRADLPEHFWAGMRTWYMTSPDLEAFSEPKRLFEFDDMATIDVIVRREGETYYALIKDEFYPSFDWPTGKTIRISTSPNLTGPWTRPGPPLTPNFREAPSVVRRPDGKGWYLYYEQYPAVAYEASTAPSLAGPWHTVFAPSTSFPAGARHGCMIELSRDEYAALMARFGKAEIPPSATDPAARE